MVPHRSPYGLIQEDLWPNEWKCLVVCVMLNCTSRKQVEKLLPSFFKKWPNAASLLSADKDDIATEISSLGFKHRRTERLIKLAAAYKTKNWRHARELPGIGDYAARMWEIFFLNRLGNDEPKDHALVAYWKWRKAEEEKKASSA